MKGERQMPTISTFYGIIILMHLRRKEHNPPHIHATYQEHEASFYISTGEIMNGSFPSSGADLVKKFILQHQKELLEMWETEVYKKLPPLD